MWDLRSDSDSGDLITLLSHTGDHRWPHSHLCLYQNLSSLSLQLVIVIVHNSTSREQKSVDYSTRWLTYYAIMCDHYISPYPHNFMACTCNCNCFHHFDLNFIVTIWSTNKWGLSGETQHLKIELKDKCWFWYYFWFMTEMYQFTSIKTYADFDISFDCRGHCRNQIPAHRESKPTNNFWFIHLDHFVYV